jgi:leader peptidase (prepilin peptidase)/N-methyltransferase
LTWEILIMVNTSLFALVLAVIDFKSKILPNKYVLALAATSIVLISTASRFNIETIFKSIYMSTLIFLAYLAMYFFSKKTFGLGDVKYSFALSLPATFLFGINQTINMHVSAFILGGIIALVLLISKKVSKNHAIAFGPFMSVSYFLFLVLSL